MPALARVRVGTISPRAGDAGRRRGRGPGPLPRLAPRLGLGCIDHCERRVETVDEVVARAEAAMRHVDKDRIVLHPDCGFAPSVQNPMDLDEAYEKLKVMCLAAARLRERHA